MSEPYQSFLLSRPNVVRSEFNKVSGIIFRDRVIELRAQHPVLEQSLHLHPGYHTFDCRMTENWLSGYAVSSDGELTNVFSLVRGGGKLAMEDAQRAYDRLHLNCFEYTESFYERAGFRTFRREPHWDSRKENLLPDVVFMEWKRTL